MGESDRPKPQPPRPLPRTWKAQPDPPADPPRAPKKASKKKADPDEAEAGSSDPAFKKPKKKKFLAPDEVEAPAPSKLEETPLLDTYEARQRVRLAIGGALIALFLVGSIVVYRVSRGKPPEPAAASTDPVDSRAAHEKRLALENESASLLDGARQSEKLGNPKAAVDLLQKIVKNYAATESAKVAMRAIDRNRRKLPLFDESADVPPRGPTAPPPAVAEGPAGPQPGPSIKPPEPDRPQNIPVATLPPPRTLPNGFHAAPGASIDPSGWPSLIVSDRDEAPLVFIPAGEFLMGRDDGEVSERPAHPVRLSNYYIDQHEVTNRQYRRYVEETGRLVGAPSDSSASRWEPVGPLDAPVVNLNAREARAYCFWTNRRLPTEAQWEMAARSTDGRVAYPQQADRARPLDKGNGAPAELPDLSAVMTDPTDVSPFGVRDMAGNATEWTSDYFDPRYFGTIRGVVVDPVGAAQSRLRPPHVTIKGGSRAGLLSWREGYRVEGKSPRIGFRGVLNLEPAPGSNPSTNPNAPAGTGDQPSVIPF